MKQVRRQHIRGLPMRASSRSLHVSWCLAVCAFLAAGPGSAAGVFAADEFLKVTDVEVQPLAAATERLIEALDYVGAPLPVADREALKGALKGTDAGKVTLAVQKVLDPHCVAGVTINAEQRVSVVAGPVKKELINQGWRTFLVKVQNVAGITSELKIESPNLAPLYKRSSSDANPKLVITPGDVPNRWLDAV